MRLKSCTKKYKKDTHRAVPPEETLSRIESKMVTAGITRVADITDLDRIGIPVFSSIRPTADDGAISVYNGKGATPEEARVSAMMEGIERYSAEVHDREMVTGRFSELDSCGNALNPDELILPQSTDPDQSIQWINGYDLVNDEEILVPASAVFHPLPLSKDHATLFRTNTNGLASGNELEEAIFHGLSEVIERDAWSLVEASRNTGPNIISPDNGMVGDLMDRFSDAEVSVQIRDMTSNIGIPTFAAVSDDLLLKDPALLTIGMGTHTNAYVAMLRAITEVAQSRLTQIHGAREDTTVAEFRTKIGYERTKRINRHWFGASDGTGEGDRDFDSITSFESDDFLDDIGYMIRNLEGAGMDRAIVVDLTRSEIDVPVVRVIVPGLEVYAMDSERSGTRCKDERNKNRRLRRTKRG
ncbi:MAG: YcaO-related McrA-glycine thioamidation protein [Methanosarcinales archaeon]|nr:YcaO-related McrA-glycine thioamidation protein [Methanosarcinales archaeon]